MPAYRYLEEIGLAAMLAAKRLAGVTPEVNLKDHVTCMPLASVSKAAQSGFETQRRHHQSPKQGYQWPHRKDLCPPKFFRKKFFVKTTSLLRSKSFVPITVKNRYYVPSLIRFFGVLDRR